MTPLQTYQETARDILFKLVADYVISLASPPTGDTGIDQAAAALTTAARTAIAEVQSLKSLSGML